MISYSDVAQMAKFVEFLQELQKPGVSKALEKLKGEQEQFFEIRKEVERREAAVKAAESEVAAKLAAAETQLQAVTRSKAETTRLNAELKELNASAAEKERAAAAAKKAAEDALAAAASKESAADARLAHVVDAENDLAKRQAELEQRIKKLNAAISV